MALQYIQLADPDCRRDDLKPGIKAIEAHSIQADGYYYFQNDKTGKI
jgi:hypothetical protein